MRFFGYCGQFANRSVGIHESFVFCVCFLEYYVLEANRIVTCFRGLMRFYQKIQTACFFLQGDCILVVKPCILYGYVVLEYNFIVKRSRADFVSKVYPKLVLHAEFHNVFPSRNGQSGKTNPRRSTFRSVYRARRKIQNALDKLARRVCNRAVFRCQQIICQIVIERQAIQNLDIRRLVSFMRPNGVCADDFSVNHPNLTLCQYRQFANRSVRHYVSIKFRIRFFEYKIIDCNVIVARFARLMRLHR